MDTPPQIEDRQLYKRLARDVCYLYHEFAEFGYIMGDLDFSNDYSLPYWDLINRVGTDFGEDRFIRSGILMLFLAMIHDQLDGSGYSLEVHGAEISRSLQQFVPEDDDMLRLSDAVIHGMEIFKAQASSDDRFESDSVWAYSTFVKQYFQDRANRSR